MPKPIFLLLSVISLSLLAPLPSYHGSYFTKEKNYFHKKKKKKSTFSSKPIPLKIKKRAKKATKTTLYTKPTAPSQGTKTKKEQKKPLKYSYAQIIKPKNKRKPPKLFINPHKKKKKTFKEIFYHLGDLFEALFGKAQTNALYFKTPGHKKDNKDMQMLPFLLFLIKNNKSWISNRQGNQKAAKFKFTRLSPRICILIIQKQKTKWIPIGLIWENEEAKFNALTNIGYTKMKSALPLHVERKNYKMPYFFKGFHFVRPNNEPLTYIINALFRNQDRRPPGFSAKYYLYPYYHAETDTLQLYIVIMNEENNNTRYHGFKTELDIQNKEYKILNARIHKKVWDINAHIKKESLLLKGFLGYTYDENEDLLLYLKDPKIEEIAAPQDREVMPPTIFYDSSHDHNASLG